MIKLMGATGVFAKGNSIEEILDELNSNSDWYYIYRPDDGVVDCYLGLNDEAAENDVHGEKADDILDVIDDGVGDEINIIFEGGQSMDGIHGCVYMLGRYVDNDGDEQELYAEVLNFDTEDGCVYMLGRYVDDDGDEQKFHTEVLDLDTNVDDDDFGYDELKAEIIKQAKEAGIDEGRLEFPGKNFS